MAVVSKTTWWATTGRGFESLRTHHPPKTTPNFEGFISNKLYNDNRDVYTHLTTRENNMRILKILATIVIAVLVAASFTGCANLDIQGQRQVPDSAFTAANNGVNTLYLRMTEAQPATVLMASTVSTNARAIDPATAAAMVSFLNNVFNAYPDIAKKYADTAAKIRAISGERDSELLAMGTFVENPENLAKIAEIVQSMQVRK